MCNCKQVSPKPDLPQTPFIERDVEAKKILLSVRMGQSKIFFLNFNDGNKTGQASMSSSSKDVIIIIKT